MYIPKNKIKTNLYTNGGELTIKSTGKNYIGRYYKLYDGRMFSGENQNTLNSQELTNINSINEDNEAKISIEPITSTKAIFPQKVENFIEKKEYDQTSILNYIILKGENPDNSSPIILPTPYYPQPTEADYKLGEFQRYFCVKSNELKYIEVTKEQYEKFKNKDESVAWQYYIAFTLPWDISGEKEQVYKTNRNIILITEQNIKRRGLQEFLRKNYLKFYKEA